MRRTQFGGHPDVAGAVLEDVARDVARQRRRHRRVVTQDAQLAGVEVVSNNAGAIGSGPEHVLWRLVEGTHGPPAGHAVLPGETRDQVRLAPRVDMDGAGLARADPQSRLAVLEQRPYLVVENL